VMIHKVPRITTPDADQMPVRVAAAQLGSHLCLPGQLRRKVLA
jgi:hypothetical protein